MAGLSLKGPARLGASELDEGALTVAVVGAYDAEDGKAGLIAAGRVLPARRELWRLVETYAPGALADALRARSSTADQTGRGGVRELRCALADWLAPWPRCHRCARPIEPDTSLVACPGAVQRVWVGKGRHPAPTLCTPHRGRPMLRGARLHRPVGRDGSLALFSPIHLDAAAAEAKSALRHGASCAYDVVVDRDGRILLSLTDPNPRNGTAPTAAAARHPLIAAARREWDRRIDVALRANGRLILKTQLRYFSPKGSVTRADLMQGGAMGCRRALMDFDASMGNKFSTYAVNWIYQGMGEVFGDRDVVHAPDWATSLHHKIEEMGLAPALVLSSLGAVAETRNRPADCHAAATEFVDLMLPTLLAVAPNLDIPGAITQAVAAAKNPPKAKTDTGDERSRERVATWAVRALGFEAATGGGLLTALRFGAATVVSTVGTGERDDSTSSGGDSDDGAGHAHRSPEHLRNNPDDNDAEAQAIEEDEARKQWAILLSGLQSLLTVDPEAAEVVRRRHALDGLGDPETLDEIAAAPLRCTARALCRESIRKAYTRGIASLKRAAAGETLARHDCEMKDEYEYDFAGTYRRRPHGPFKPTRPENVSTMVAAPYETPHTAEDFDAWGEAVSAAALVF
jgi:hypothetical protein